MCMDLSGILKRPIGDFVASREVIRDPNTSHHSDLIALHSLHGEGRAQEYFVRFEYTAKSGRWTDRNAYALTIDEQCAPSWLTPELRQALDDDCWRHAQSITISSDRAAVVGGTWIISGTVRIDRVCRCKFLVGVGAELTISEQIVDNLILGDVYGTVTTDAVLGTVTTGAVYGTVTTGAVYGTGSVKTGTVSGEMTTGIVLGTVTTGTVSGTGSVKTDAVYDTGSVKTGDVHGAR